MILTTLKFALNAEFTKLPWTFEHCCQFQKKRSYKTIFFSIPCFSGVNELIKHDSVHTPTLRDQKIQHSSGRAKWSDVRLFFWDNYSKCRFKDETLRCENELNVKPPDEWCIWREYLPFRRMLNSEWGLVLICSACWSSGELFLFKFFFGKETSASPSECLVKNKEMGRGARDLRNQLNKNRLA